MRKVPFELFKKLKNRFEKIKSKYGLNYELIPYFISSHPGCTDSDMAALASEVKSLGIKPEQVQDFTPTPMTLSSYNVLYRIRSVFGEEIVCCKKDRGEEATEGVFFLV